MARRVPALCMLRAATHEDLGAIGIWACRRPRAWRRKSLGI